MRFSFSRIARAWLCISIVLLLAAMNCNATVLCIEPDGSITYEVTDAHGRCAPCPGSTEKDQTSDSDNCVDVPLVSSSDIKMGDTSTALFEKSNFPEGSAALVYLSWLSASLQIVLHDTESRPYKDYQVLTSNPFLARSVILLI